MCACIYAFPSTGAKQRAVPAVRVFGTQESTLRSASDVLARLKTEIMHAKVYWWLFCIDANDYDVAVA